MNTNKTTKTNILFRRNIVRHEAIRKKQTFNESIKDK